MGNIIRPNEETQSSATEEKCIFRTAIEKYINLLNAQLDSFPLVFNTLAINVKTCINHFDKFTKENNIKIEKDESKNNVTYEVPIELGKEFERVKDELSRSISAFSLIPKNTVVAMVSVYDAFLADIIECAYTIKPQLLNACEKEFSFSDIIKFGSIENLKKHVLEKDVESIIRESHTKQLEILSKKFSVELTKDLPSYKDFIEITERRNLFVHTNGKVSSQYLKICTERPLDHKEKDVQIGEELSVSPIYILNTAIMYCLK